MGNRTRLVALIVLLGFFATFVCVVVAGGAFLVGRRAAVTGVSATQLEEIADVATVDRPQNPEQSDEQVEGAETTLEVTVVTPEEEDNTDSEESSTAATNDETVSEPDRDSAADATQGRDPEDKFTEEDLQLLWEVWQIIEAEYDGELPDDEELTYSAIQGVLKTLGDDFTRFAPPDVAERMREDLQGSFEGIGAFVRENEAGNAEIVRPMDGQPADIAGLKAGDVVTAVDGESMIGRSLDEVIALIRGPEGTEVVLTIAREGVDEPFEVAITRKRIEILTVESEMLDEGIAYVRLTSFNRQADSELRAAIEELLAQDPQGLILDLRDNPGGYLDQSIAVSDIFLPEGIVLYDRSSTFGTDDAYRSDDGDLAEDIPLVVLINAGSASASEIVAGAIKDHGRGTLIGETTFGKGSVQQSHMLSDGSELRVTIARWYTPNNESIDGTGIEPHIEVPTPDTLGGEGDTQLERAVEFLTEGQ